MLAGAYFYIVQVRYAWAQERKNGREDAAEEEKTKKAIVARQGKRRR